MHPSVTAAMVLRDLGAAFPADHREEEEQVGDPPLPVAPGHGGPEVPEHQLPADDLPEQGGQRPGTLGPAGSRHGIHPAQAQPVAQAGEAGVDHQRGVARPPTQRETAAAAGRRQLRAPAQQQVRDAALLASTRGPALVDYRMRHGNTTHMGTDANERAWEPGPGIRHTQIHTIHGSAGLLAGRVHRAHGLQGSPAADQRAGAAADLLVSPILAGAGDSVMEVH